MQKKSISRYKSFSDCLNDFKNAKNKDITDSFILSGIIQKFCLTFDLSWNLMKDIIIEEYLITDFISGSPREVLKMAKKVEIIDDDLWLEMLTIRNNLTHDYNNTVAKTTVSQIVNVYIDTFIDFEKNIKKFYE